MKHECMQMILKSRVEWKDEEGRENFRVQHYARFLATKYSSFHDWLMFWRLRVQLRETWHIPLPPRYPRNTWLDMDTLPKFRDSPPIKKVIFSWATRPKLRDSPPIKNVIFSWGIHPKLKDSPPIKNVAFSLGTCLKLRDSPPI